LHRSLPDVPIIIITGLEDESVALRMVREGAQDYLVKGHVEGHFLARAIRYAIVRKRAEQAVRKSEARFRCLFDSKTIGFIVADPLGSIHEANDAFLEMVGRSSDDLVAGQLRLDTITPPEYADRDRQALLELEQNGVAGPWEKEYLRPNGDRVPVHVGMARLPGKSAECISYVVDLTERNRAAESIQWLSQAVQQSPASVLITDTHGRIEYVNQRFTEDTDYTVTEVMGKTPEILKSGEIPQEVYKGLWKTITCGAEWQGELLNRKKNGERFWGQASISPLRNSKGVITHFLGIQQDITQRKQAESEIRRLNDNLECRVLERTEQLEAANTELVSADERLKSTNRELEAFTYSVSHDLRAPLRQIDGFSRILVDHLGSGVDSKSQHYLRRIQEGTQHMGRLVDDLLGLAQLGRQDVHTRPTPLNAIVKETLNELRADATDRMIQWTVGDLPWVECDPGLMKIVFTNLLSNAIKYTRPREMATIEVGCSLSDGWSTVFVRDNGVGFNMKYADKLFGVFQRLHRADQFEGTGVGLATVQRIIHKHGGEVWAEAEPDRGATFFFSLARLGDRPVAKSA
jgi:PAS domain S-box-containing protein